jgi:hypothetical protein
LSWKRRVVVESAPLHVRLAGDLDGVAHGAVAPVLALGELVGCVLRIVDEEVDAFAQLEHRVVDMTGAARRLW